MVQKLCGIEKKFGQNGGQEGSVQKNCRKSICRGRLLGQIFASSDRGRGPLQDEHHSGSRPCSFPGLCLTRSGMAPEWFRGVPVVAAS